MATKHALVVGRNAGMTPNGMSRSYQIVSGKKGTGSKKSVKITYWPWSDASCDQAYRDIRSIQQDWEDNGYTVNWEE